MAFARSFVRNNDPIKLTVQYSLLSKHTGTSSASFIKPRYIIGLRICVSRKSLYAAWWPIVSISSRSWPRFFSPHFHFTFQFLRTAKTVFVIGCNVGAWWNCDEFRCWVVPRSESDSAWNKGVLEHILFGHCCGSGSGFSPESVRWLDPDSESWSPKYLFQSGSRSTFVRFWD